MPRDRRASRRLDSAVNFALAEMLEPRRLFAAGDLDLTFGGDGRVVTEATFLQGRAADVAVQADGKIVAALSLPGEQSFVVARYNADGTLDTSFDGDGKVTTDIFSLGYDEAFSVAIHANGKIVAAGSGYSGASARSFFTLVQYNVDGSLDTSFDGDGKATAPTLGHSRAKSVAIQADGKIVAVGENCCTNNKSNIVGFRFNADGSVNGQWGTNPAIPGFFGSANGHSVAIQPDGKIVTVGNLENDQNHNLVIVRSNPDLTNDLTFGTNGLLITPLDSYSYPFSHAIQLD